MNLGFSLSSGAVSAVLISTHPLFAALFAHFMISGDTLSPGRAFGLLVALGGTALIVLRGGGMSGAEFSLAGATIVLGSSLMLGWRLIFAARQTRKFEPTRVVFWMMGLSIIPFAAGGALFEEIAWSKLGWEPVAGILYQGIVIAGLGFMVNAELMKRYSPAAMSSFAFIAPISGVLLSVWLLDEHFTWIIAIGTVCVGAGLVLIARPRKKAN
jgi:drug/metabolite transporter (DMT)-like permease